MTDIDNAALSEAGAALQKGKTMSMNVKDKNSINSADVIKELDAGVFGDKIGMALDEIGRAAIYTGKVAKLKIELTVKQYGDSRQVEVVHEIQSEIPEVTGSAIYKDKKKSSLYIHTDKTWSYTPETQGAFKFDKSKT